MEKVKCFVRNNPHVWWTLFLPAYLAAFFLMEAIVPTDHYWVTQLPIDAQIPFLEGFVVFYSAWAPLLVLLGIYLMLRDPENFRRYIWTMMITFFASTLFCILVPNGQDLRPAVLPRDNLFCRLVGLIYTLDTNTNVFPSVHVVGVMSALFALWHTPSLRKTLWPIVGTVIGILITLSTLFIRQHAVLDVLASLLLSAVAYYIVYICIARRRDGQLS